MKLMKKTLALFTSALIMIMASFNVMAYSDVPNSSTAYEAIETLSVLDILTGFEDNTFKPEDKVTRAQMAAIICRASGYNYGETATQGSTSFTDVPVGHWATAYIEMAESMGIINGYGEGLFGPEDEVTYDQAVKMIVCALGYQKKAEAMVKEGINPFPSAYNAIANQKGITNGVVKTAGGASRATIAELVYNALTVNLMDQTSFGTDIEFKEIPNQSLLYTKLNAVLMDAKIDDIDLDNTNNTVNFVSNSIKLDKVAVLNEVSSDFITIKRNNINVSELQGLNVTALVDISDSSDYKLLAIFPTEKATTLEIDAMLFSEIKDNKICYYKSSDSNTVNTSFRVKDLVAYRNLEPLSGQVTIDVASGDTTLRFVDNNNDGYYDTLFIDNYKSFIVGKVYESDYEIRPKSSGSIYNSADIDYEITLDPEDETVSWTITDENGKELDISDISIGDVVTYAKSEIDNNTYYDITICKTTSIVGTVDEYYYDKNTNGIGTYYYVIDGKEYTLNTLEKEGSSAIDVGSYGTFTLTADGKIIAFDLDKTSKNFGILIDIAETSNSFDESVKALIMDISGKIKTYSLTDKLADAYIANSNKYTKGDLIEYEVKSDGTIKSIKYKDDVVSDDYSFTGLKTGNYSVSSNKIGNAYFIDNSVIVAVKGNVDDKSNYSVITDGAFVDTDEYTYKAILNEDREVVLMLVTDFEILPTYDSIPLYITGLAQISVDGDKRIKLEGYVGDDEVEYVLAEEVTKVAMYKDCLLSTDVVEGDVIQFVLNGDDEITAYRHLVKVDENYAYMVAASDLDTADEGAKETASVEYKYSLTDGEFVVASKDIGIVDGFGAFGRVQRVNNKTVGIFTKDAIANEDYEAYVDVTGDPELPLFVASNGRHLVKSLSSIKTYKSQGNVIDKTDDVIYIFKYDDKVVLQYAIDTLGDNK